MGFSGKIMVKEMFVSILCIQVGDVELVLVICGNLNNDFGVLLILL